MLQKFLLMTLKSMNVTLIMLPLTLMAFLLPAGATHAQDNALFSEKTPLDIQLRVSIKNIRQTSEDTVYTADQLIYKNAAGNFDTIDITLKSRGNYRLKECFFPPLSVKLKANEAAGTPFEGNKKLKLVLPCKNQDGNNNLILKEYLCYKLYEAITPFAFKTRLINIEFSDEGKGKTKSYDLKGIIVEDDEHLAGRFDARLYKNVISGLYSLQDTADLRMSFFQLLIANTDWSSMYQHNIKLLSPQQQLFIPVAYDFDMSGLVDAPYAVVSTIGDEKLNILNVRERIYRGWCRDKSVTQFVRNEYLAKEAELMSVPDELNGVLSEKEIAGIKNYMKEFFDILRKDNVFERYILSGCRSSK